MHYSVGSICPFFRVNLQERRCYLRLTDEEIQKQSVEYLLKVTGKVMAVLMHDWSRSALFSLLYLFPWEPGIPGVPIGEDWPAT